MEKVVKNIIRFLLSLLYSRQKYLLILLFSTGIFFSAKAQFWQKVKDFFSSKTSEATDAISGNIQSIRILDFGTVNKAFNEIPLNSPSMMILASSLAVLFAVILICKKGGIFDDSEVDIARIMKLVKGYGITLAIVFSVPLLITGIESILGLIEKEYLSALGSAPSDKLLKACENELTRYSIDALKSKFSLSVAGLVNSGIYLLDWMGTAILKPILVMIDNWSYAFALFYRFTFLGILKMVGAFCVACGILDETRHIYVSYIKKLMACYLLIPAFMFVSNFTDGIRDQFITSGGIQIGILFIMVFLKLVGYAAAANLVQKSLS